MGSPSCWVGARSGERRAQLELGDPNRLEDVNAVRHRVWHILFALMLKWFQVLGGRPCLDNPCRRCLIQVLELVTITGSLR